MKKDASIRRLRITVITFVIALMIPAIVLVMHAYSQLKWETYFQYNRLGDGFVKGVHSRLIQFIEREEARTFGDFQFLVVSGDPSVNYLKPSALSTFPVEDQAGLMGYFQVDANGQFTSPLLPENLNQTVQYGISPEQVKERKQTITRLLAVLQDNALVSKKTGLTYTPPLAEIDEAKSLPEEELDGSFLEDFADARVASEPAADMAMESAPMPQTASPAPQELKSSAFDSLNRSAGALGGDVPLSKSKNLAKNKLGKVKDLELEESYQLLAQEKLEQRREKQKSTISQEVMSVAPAKKRQVRKEQIALPVLPSAPIKLFESEIEPYQFSLLNSGHFVLYRQVWREGKRTIQGAIFEQKAFIDEFVGDGFSQSQLARISQLIVAYQDEVLEAFTGLTGNRYSLSRSDLQGEILYRSSLPSPFERLELIFSVQELPVSDSASVINYTFAVFFMILLLSGWLFYRLGYRQLKLVRQQQDFVSAVSHELKTPLTSIRMYGEILKAGWAGEEKKQEYYQYIFDESERLSRLINNVLQLARLNRNEMQLELKTLSVAQVMDMVRSRIQSHCEASGFELSVTIDETIGNSGLKVDTDSVLQMMINLVDNGIKFSSGADRKEIQIYAKPEGGWVSISVRDFGPGIPKKNMKQIFGLFYRMENELTRETVGTGIGLALVQQLANTMGASVDVMNRNPGAEFSLRFPIESSSQSPSDNH